MADCQSAPSTSASSNGTTIPAVSEALGFLANGKRNFVCGDYVAATQAFEKSTQLLAEHYGELAYECAESYLFYGRSLLELSRMESGVLGNALEGIDEDKEEDEKDADIVDKEAKPLTDEEKEKLSDDIIDAMEEKESVAGNKEATTGDSKDETETNEDKEKGDNGGIDEEGNGEDDEEEEEADDEEQVDDAEDKEEVSNLQVAWETLDIAKVIYSKSDTRADKLMMAECLLRIGEVSCETENFGQAVADLEECVRLREELLEGDDRLVAESLYQLAVAHSSVEQFEQAVETFKKALSIVQLRCENLKSKIAETEDLKKELEELDGLVPDIRSRIEDAQDEQSTYKKMKAIAKESVQEEVTTTGFGTSAADLKANVVAASDISNLVRKKRKPEEEVDVAKKMKVEEKLEDSATNDVQVKSVVDTEVVAER